jgi:hypothetical protein
MDRFSQVLEFRIREGFRIDGIGTGLLGFLDFDEFFDIVGFVDILEFLGIVEFLEILEFLDIVDIL